MKTFSFPISAASEPRPQAPQPEAEEILPPPGKTCFVHAWWANRNHGEGSHWSSSRGFYQELNTEVLSFLVLCFGNQEHLPVSLGVGEALSPFYLMWLLIGRESPWHHQKKKQKKKTVWIKCFRPPDFGCTSGHIRLLRLDDRSVLHNVLALQQQGLFVRHGKAARLLGHLRQSYMKDRMRRGLNEQPSGNHGKASSAG